MPSAETRIGPDDWPGAVADSDGYQILVAGPGTGKTEFLVRRVAHLVREGKAARDEILVLCFSRRAAGDLRRRIDESAGATGIPIDASTFHSLALRLVEAARGGNPPVVLTTPEQVGLVAKLLADEDPADWPLIYRGILNTTGLASEVADFLMRCSERLLGPEELAALATERADWRALPAFFAKYLERLEESGRTDYGVLLTSALEALAAQGRGLADFRYVLVDEYQDTTPAHAALADLLAKGHGNLTVAGDPYQSIYSFRGAELRNIAAFETAHPGARRRVLTTSFRVPAPILDGALRVVEAGELPGAAGHVAPAPHGGSVEAHIFDQETAEAEWIADQVEDAVVVAQTPPERIAVLVRSKREMVNELSRALDRRGIPHDPPAGRLVDHPAIVLLDDLVKVSLQGGPLPLVTPSQAAEANRAMRRVLLGPMYGLPLGRERAMMRVRASTWGGWAEVVASELPDAPGLARLISDPEWAAARSAAEGFWHVWTTLDGVPALVTDPDRTSWRAALASFAQILNRQATRDPIMTMARYFELTGEEGFEAEPLISPDPSTKRVTLSTLHQAKGLEFDLVFIANAVEGVFPDLRRSRRMLRPELLSPERTTDASSLHRFQLQEEMRLAYTAMTRARHRVVWTATDAGIDQGEKRPSRFMAAAAGTPLLKLGRPTDTERDPYTPAEMQSWLRRSLLDPAAPIARRLAAVRLLAAPPRPWWEPAHFAGVALPGPDTPILGQTFRLSPSQADAYRACPRNYALERRLRLGDADSPYAHFGSLVHEALDRAEREIIGTGARHADKADALAHLKQVWAESADFGSAQLTEAWLTKAVAMMEKLYDRWPGKGPPVEVEQMVEGEVAGIPWLGRIDRVEQGPNGLRIVDYKTSTRETPKEEAARSLQLAFYALALARGGHEVAAAEMWFPRSKTKSVATRSLDMDRLEELTEEMAEVTRSITSENWGPSPGRHCGNCQFKLSCPAWPEGRGAYLP